VTARTDAASRLNDLLSFGGALKADSHKHKGKGNAGIENNKHVVEGIVFEPKARLSHKLVPCKSTAAAATGLCKQNSFMCGFFKPAARTSACAHNVGLLGDVEQPPSLDKNCTGSAAVEETTLSRVDAHRRALIGLEVVGKFGVQSSGNRHLYKKKTALVRHHTPNSISLNYIL